MYVFIYSIIFFLITIITRIKYNRYLKVNLIFTTIWSLFAALSSFGLLNMRKPGVEVHILVLTVIIVFNFFYFLISKNIIKNKKQELGMLTKFQIKLKLLYTLNIVCILILLPFALISVQRFFSTGILGFRGELIRELTFNDYSIIFIRDLPSAVFTTTIIIFSVLVFLKRYNRFLVFIVITDLIFYTLVFGGRYLILRFIVSIFIGATVFTAVKVKKRYLLFGLLAIFLITQIRTKDSYTIMESIILYYSGPFSFLDLILSNPEEFGLFTESYYGYFLFGSIIEPFVLFMKFVLNVNWEVPSYLINIYTQQFYNIGSNEDVLFNNSTTMIYPFLMDFGYFGPIIGTGLLATVIANLENSFLRNSNIKSLVFFIFFTLVLVDSVLSYTIISAQSGMILLLIFILIKRKKVTT